MPHRPDSDESAESSFAAVLNIPADQKLFYFPSLEKNLLLMDDPYGPGRLGEGHEGDTTTAKMEANNSVSRATPPLAFPFSLLSPGYFEWVAPPRP